MKPVAWTSLDPRHNNVVSHKRNAPFTEPLVTLSSANASIEAERLRFEGDLDRWMKTIGAGISGYQPEAYAVMDAACEELVRLRERAASLEAMVVEAGKALERLEAVALKQPIAGGPDNVHLHNDWRGWWGKLFRPAMQDARSIAAKIGGLPK